MALGNYHVTNPEAVYAHIPVDSSMSLEAQMRAGRSLLAELLGVEDSNSFAELSSAMQARVETYERPPMYGVDYGRHVLRLLRTYPFLRHNPIALPKTPKNDTTISAKLFDAWIGNHLFDDYPHLFGVSAGEAHDFRRSVNARNYNSDIKPLFEALDLKWDFKAGS